MKKILFWAMATLCAAGLQSCDNKDDDYVSVSAELQEAFGSRYPNASRVDWELKGPFYEAEFVEKGYENKAWFTPDGTWVMTEYDIPFAQLPQAVSAAFKSGAYASWRVDDVDMIEETGTEVVYVIEVEQGEKEYELTYLEDGTLIREDTGWGEHAPIVPGQAAEVKELVMAKYPQAVILDIEEEKGGIEVEIREGGRQKEVYCRQTDGVLSWIHTTYEIGRHEFTTLPEGVQQAFAALSGSGMTIDDVDFFETETGNYYRVEVEDRGAEKYVYVAENGEMLQMKLKNYA